MRRCSARSRRPSASTNRSTRSEEHTSELQSQSNLVCRLLLEKKEKVVPPCLLGPSVRDLTVTVAPASALHGEVPRAFMQELLWPERTAHPRRFVPATASHNAP